MRWFGWIGCCRKHDGYPEALYRLVCSTSSKEQLSWIGDWKHCGWFGSQEKDSTQCHADSCIGICDSADVLAWSRWSCDGWRSAFSFSERAGSTRPPLPDPNGTMSWQNNKSLTIPRNCHYFRKRNYWTQFSFEFEGKHAFNRQESQPNHRYYNDFVFFTTAMPLFIGKFTILASWPWSSKELLKYTV